MQELASLDKTMWQTLLVVFLVATHLHYSDPVLQIQVQQINLQTSEILSLQDYRLLSSVLVDQHLVLRSRQKKKIKVLIKKMNRKINLSYLIHPKRILPPTQPIMHSDLFKKINQKKKTPLAKTHHLVRIPVKLINLCLGSRLHRPKINKTVFLEVDKWAVHRELAVALHFSSQPLVNLEPVLSRPSKVYSDNRKHRAISPTPNPQRHLLQQPTSLFSVTKSHQQHLIK